jgi:ribosome maturation factor RimP
MEKELFYKVVETAASERGLVVVEIKFDDDDNVFEVTIDRPGADVDLADCEYVHRAVLTAFDRDVEDYSLTVTSVGIDAAEADELLKSTNE